MDFDSDFEAVRREDDPIRQALLAADLQERHLQLANEAARLRRLGIDRAGPTLGLPDREVAARLGISPGRVSQIRKTGPAAERIFFGVGPISVGVPLRYLTTDRQRPLIAAEDAGTADELTQTLAAMKFAVSRYQIEPDQAELPGGDAVVVCGPKSAPVAAVLLARDPALRMVHVEERWWIEETATGIRHGSPLDDTAPHDGDIAYVARHVIEGRVVVHIAGIHGIGSRGAVDYLTGNLAAVFDDVGEQPCSLVVRSTHDGLDITGSDLLAGPYVW